MKKYLILTVFISFIALSIAKKPSASSKKFKLVFNEIGLGSNMFADMPRFEIIDSNFIYTLGQKWSWKGEQIKSPDTICSGLITTSAVDSLVDLMLQYTDSATYKFSSAMSGTIHELAMEYGNKKVSVTLKNAHDSIAADIISILNAYIPADKERIYPHNIPAYDVEKEFELMEMVLEKRKNRKGRKQVSNKLFSSSID